MQLEVYPSPEVSGVRIVPDENWPVNVTAWADRGVYLDGDPISDLMGIDRWHSVDAEIVDIDVTHIHPQRLLTIYLVSK